LGGRKGTRPVKNKSGGVLDCWRGYLSGARCRLAYGPAHATATHLFLASVTSRLAFKTILVPADLGSTGKRAVKWVCVCVLILGPRHMTLPSRCCALAPAADIDLQPVSAAAAY